MGRGCSPMDTYTYADAGCRTPWHSLPLHEMVDPCHGSGLVAGAKDVCNLKRPAFALHEHKEFSRCQQAVAQSVLQHVAKHLLRYISHGLLQLGVLLCLCYRAAIRY